MTSDSDEGPPWDQDLADWLVGKYVLVGLTVVAPDRETVVSQVQYHGRVVSADRDNGISVACEGEWSGQTMGLPPQTDVFKKASPGEYRLRSTGEVVTDPDAVASWTIHQPAN